jgi:CHAT domain-containing protein
MLLAEALARRGRGTVRMDYAAIAALSQTGPLVYLDAGLERGLALVVKPAGDPMRLWLPGLTETVVREHAARFSAAREHAGHEPARWRAQLLATTGWLWQIVVEPLLPVLEGAAACRLIAGYYLPFLPLHAAWTDSPEAPDGRAYFSDRLLVTCAPSALALQRAFAGAGREATSFLGIAEPQPVGGAPLPAAAVEVAFAAPRFSRPLVLSGLAATLKATRTELPRHAVLHFACHGHADLARPLKNGLLLANDRVLTLADCLQTRLEAARVAVLSACETGIMGTQLPDEVVSLPTGLLQAGVPGVVASLWRVGDQATALLMARFYELWRDEQQPPASALRAAQAWLRQRTNAELARHFATTPGLAAALADRPGEARDFAAPEHWAGFYYTGV